MATQTTGRIYRGFADDKAARITVHDGDRQYPLSLRLDLINHSSTGFQWGYGGSGPAQTALAILADALGDDARALRLHQRFKDAKVACIQHHRWTLDQAEIIAWAAAQGST